MVRENLSCVFILCKFIDRHINVQKPRFIMVVFFSLKLAQDGRLE